MEQIPMWVWVAFNLFVLAMLALDLGVFHRKAHEVKLKEALGWSAVWITLALVFNVIVWQWRGAEAGMQCFGPHRLRPRKVTPGQEALILDLRRTRKLGPKALQRELLRLHQLRFSTRTIWKVLHAHGVSQLRPDRRPRQPKRYTRPVPGDRVQIDTCKIGPGLIQFTAIDDCTRMRVLGLYASRTATDAVHFLRQRLLQEFPFPIQRIQSDRGSEFIGFEFQQALQEQHIKFRPNRPRAPHLNGKVERSQRTDRTEFWSTVDRKAPREVLEAQLAQWQTFYNQERTYSAIGSQTPLQRLQEKLLLVPSLEEVYAAYDSAKVKRIKNTYSIWVPFEQLTPKEQRQFRRKHPSV